MKKCLAFINENIYTNSLKAIGYSIQPEKVTIDKSGFNNAALKSINKYLAKDNKIEIRHIKYYNNIEQDHRFIKKITKPMQGFKAFKSAFKIVMIILSCAK
jgi:putative transposase